MGFFDKIKEPVFMKESSSLTEQLVALEEILQEVPQKHKGKIEQEIRNVKAGISGEEQIAFELKNSHIPMCVLRDLYLEKDGLTAQIDFLVLTRRRNFVIECKNLYGDIEITAEGDFIRNISFGGRQRKERIYSPITQNERHLGLIKALRRAERKNVLTQAIFDKAFPQNYRSLVVMANAKMLRRDTKAKKEMKEIVIAADQLVAQIKKINNEKGAEDCAEKDMIAVAQFFLEADRPQPDYTARFRQMIEENLEAEREEIVQIESSEDAVPEEAPCIEEKKTEESQILCPRCGAEMVLRTAAKGERVGKSFYGCSQYPKCRGIVNIDE